MIEIGYGDAVITPPLGVSMAGYFEERRATSVHDELHARALVFDDGATRTALMVCDLIAITTETVAAIRQRVEAATGIAGDHVMVCATHTHTGPQTRPTRLEAGDPTLAWLAELPELAARAVATAVGNLQPCRLEAGGVYEDRIAFNRRFRMRDGTVRTNPGQLNADIVEPAAPIDPQVEVVGCRGGDGQLHAVFVNYACHLDTVGGTEISADYPGYLVARLRERLGDDPGVLFANGACGDINHIDVRSRQPRKGHEHARWMGETLAGDACAALAATGYLAAAPVRVAGEVLQLPLAEGSDEDAKPVEIQALRVGDLGLVGIPAEYFVELQLDIKARSPLPRTCVLELANGSIGYVPTRAAFDENMAHVSSTRMERFDHLGYEVRSALSRGYLPGVGEAIADGAVRLLQQLAD